MPAALSEFTNGPNCVGERGGIIRQGRADLIAVNVVGPSDREKVARHLALRNTALVWDHANMGASAGGSRFPQGQKRVPQRAISGSSAQFWSPASRGAPPGLCIKPGPEQIGSRIRLGGDRLSASCR
jgi:hypothetical protein